MSGDDELQALIHRAIGKKLGNDEFALFYFDGRWQASIGNTCSHVMLGEVAGEYEAEGSTPIDAVLALIEKMP